MENARFSIKIKPTKNYFSNGKDELEFLFSANKGGSFGELKKLLLEENYLELCFL